ncbi:MAG: right-handed parallel beta-helix repeat-containing protein [Candidatus Coatesbacteria bacterium]|nr:right-handed parallel beta-helix repeat-containing protein [Candidatus Coatesbacteria bacterium]
MKMRIIGAIAVAIVVSAILPAAAIAAPQVSIYTDKQSYQAGETIEVSLSGQNEGEGMSVDVYVGLLTPDGGLWTLGELAWTQGIWPWVRDIYLSSGFNMGRTASFSFPLPCEAPPIDQPGEFAFMAALMHSGTFDFASAMSAAPFEVVQVPRDYYVDAELGDDASDGSQEAPWRTITHALDTTVAFNLSPVTVHVSAGTYSASTNGETFPLNMRSFLSLVGERADATILDAHGASSSVICFSRVHDSTIEGFTITGGDSDCGGGIYCFGSSPTIRHNTITGNSAYNGGGIYCHGGWPTLGSATVSDNIISGNSASNGGGIYCDGGSPTVSDNVISDNSAYGAHGGGGIQRSSGRPTIQNNMIEGNSAYMYGGGIGCYRTEWAVIAGNTLRSNSGDSGGGVGSYFAMVSIFDNSISHNSGRYGGGIHHNLGWVEISNNAISGNWAGSCGGGIVCVTTANVFVRNNQLVGNSTGGAGGGICCNWADAISNNLIAHNIAGKDGGGIYCEYPTMFENNTISGNAAGGLGGGLYSWSDTPSNIIDSIVWNNGDDLYNCTATFCCIEDPEEGQGNIHDDPMFVPGPYGDLYLQPQSPCINAGSRSAEDAGLSGMTTQEDGTPDTGTVDMGVHYQIPSRQLMRTSLEFQE